MSRAARDWLLGGLAALLALVVLLLAHLTVWPLGFSTDRPQPRLLSGMYGVEQFTTLRASWTRAQATLALPQLPAGAPAILALTLHNGRPAGAPEPQVALHSSARNLGEFTVISRIDGQRIYELLLPPAAARDWATRVALQSETFRPEGDRRNLGVVLIAAQVTPLTAPLLPAPWFLFWAAVLGVAVYALPRSAGAGPGAAFGLATGLSLLVALGVVLRPLEVLPFVHRLALLLGLAVAAVWLARLLTGVRAADAGVLAVRGSYLPVFFGVAWWAGLTAQLLLRADGAAVYPGTPQLWIGSGLLLALIALAGWAATAGRRLAPDVRAATIARAATVFFVVVALLALVDQLRFAFGRSAPDFWILFRGTREWARGGSFYDLEAVLTNHFGHVFKVPPFYGMLFRPFVFQDGLLILFFHRLLNLLLIAATALLWQRMWGLKVVSFATAGVVIALNFRPLVDTLAFGQIDLLLLFLLTAALWALRERRDLLAGVLIALGTLFKIYPLLLLAFLVVKRRWYGLAGFALGMLLFNGLALALVGWEMHRVYLFEVVPAIGGTTSWVENQTISGFLARLVATPTEAFILTDRGIALLGIGLSLLCIGLASLLALNPAPARSTTFALQYSQFLLLMTLAVPAAWMHYQTLLFLVFVALLLHYEQRAVGLQRALLLAAAFGLIAFGNQWTYYDGTVMGVLTIFGISYKFYGMLLLGGVLVSAILAERAPVKEIVAEWAPLGRLLGVPGARRAAGRGGAQGASR